MSLETDWQRGKPKRQSLSRRRQKRRILFMCSVRRIRRMAQGREDGREEGRRSQAVPVRLSPRENLCR